LPLETNPLGARPRRGLGAPCCKEKPSRERLRLLSLENEGGIPPRHSRESIRWIPRRIDSGLEFIRGIPPMGRGLVGLLSLEPLLGSSLEVEGPGIPRIGGLFGWLGSVSGLLRPSSPLIASSTGDSRKVAFLPPITCCMSSTVPLLISTLPELDRSRRLDVPLLVALAPRAIPRSIASAASRAALNGVFDTCDAAEAAAAH